MTYEIRYFNARVEAQITSWPTGIRASFGRLAKQIIVSGPNLGMPYTKAMGGGLFEIRAQGPEGIGRAFFCCLVGQRVIILHGFIKKTQAPPPKELTLALKRLKEVKNATP